MDSDQREYLDKRHATSQWHGRSTPDHRMIAAFDFSGSELTGWELLRARRDTRGTPPALRTLWHRGDPAVELVAIDVWVCISVAAAHDQLLEVLGNVQSDAVERHKGRGGVGDVAFALGHSMAVFARINVVVLVRNAGPKTVEIDPVAQAIDRILVQLSAPDGSPRGRARRGGRG
jgi:hypothetical protein